MWKLITKHVASKCKFEIILLALRQMCSVIILTKYMEMPRIAEMFSYDSLNYFKSHACFRHGNILVKSRSPESNQTKIKHENCRPGFIESVRER